MKLTLAEWFAGIGGFSVGASREGIETVYFCENDEFKLNVLKSHYPNAIYETDIETAQGIYADIYSAGFPCQDASAANPKGKGMEGPETGKFYLFMDLVRRFRPKFIILENSPMLISRRGALAVFGELAACGYDAEWQIIGKRTFLFPDERERFICIAYDNKIGWVSDKPIFNRIDYRVCEQQIRARNLESKFSGISFNSLWTNLINGLCPKVGGVSRSLDYKKDAPAISAYGDAICPDVAQLCFYLIKQFYG